MNKNPDFICLGVHKSGTSWLYNCLYEHPEVFIQDKIDYFYREDRFKKGVTWYNEFFISKDQKISGDLSPVYLFNQTNTQQKSTAQRIYDYKPDIKLIVILRNPIERAYSHYLQDIKTGHLRAETLFNKALEKNPNILDWGMYRKHLQPFMQLFNKEQLLVLLFEDITQKPNQLLREVYEFLGVNSDFIPKSVTKKINPARVPIYQKLDFYKRKTSRLLKRYKWGERMWWQLKHSIFLKTYYKLNSKKNSALKLRENNVRTFLLSYYKDDIAYVKTLLNRQDFIWE